MKLTAIITLNRVHNCHCHSLCYCSVAIKFRQSFELMYFVALNIGFTFTFNFIIVYRKREKMKKRLISNAFRGHQIYFNEALISPLTISSFLLFWVSSLYLKKYFVNPKKKKNKKKHTHTK